MLGSTGVWAQSAGTFDHGDVAVSYNELWLTRSYEEGVANRLLLDYRGVHRVGDCLEILAGVGYSFLEQSGLALLGAGVQYHLVPLKSHFGVGLAHERWSSWGASENRFLGYWTFQPLPVLELTLGGAYRSMQYSGTDLRHSLSVPTGSAEANLVYRLQWEFLHVRSVGLSALLWNYDRMRLYTPDNIHLSLVVDVRLLDNWTLTGIISAGISGISGAILAWSQNNVSLGVAYALY